MLLLANTMILAHAVIPHHHNGVVASVCGFNEASEHVHFCSHGHDSNTNQDVEDCVLSDLYLHVSQDDNPHAPSDTELFTNWDYSSLFAVVPNHKIEIKDYGNLPFRQKPHIISSYNHYITCSLGLRAPPIC